jgi:apolipoprotein N-acyltransferase
MKPRLFIPAIITGPLLWAAFFPLNLGPLAFIALVPWLTLVRAPVSGKRLYFAGYLGGVAFFLPATQWFRVAHPMMYFSWLGLTFACPLFWLLGLFLLRRIDRLKLVPLTVSVPVVWVALEYARAHFPTGFPFLQHVGLYQMIGFGWYFLGYTQHEFAALTQIADLGGVYAVSFIVAAVNGALAERVLQMEAVRRWLRWEPIHAMHSRSKWVGGLIAVATIYGVVQLNHEPFATGPRVAAIQASVAQDDKMDDAGGLFVRYNRLCVKASQDADLVVWPETCYPFGWYELAAGFTGKPPEEFEKLIQDGRRTIQKVAVGVPARRGDASAPWRSQVLLGLNSYEWDGSREVPANTAMLFDTEGHPHGRYDKMHLVPFGEYVPLRETFPWMKFFAPYKHDYSCRPGESWTRFILKARDGRSFTFGCLICYEDTDPYMARQYVRTEPVDFLVNISNDGWFNGTEEHEEHVAICRFRAIESRKSVVRAVNMGISCVIDPDGRVIALPGDSWTGSKKMDGIAVANVPLDTRESQYARFGDWLPGLCWLLLAMGHLKSMWNKRIRARSA